MYTYTIVHEYVTTAHLLTSFCQSCPPKNDRSHLKSDINPCRLLETCSAAEA
jgi:hypothetical protein